MTAEPRDLLDLLDDGRRRATCPCCGLRHCLTPLGLIWGHGPRTGPCRGSWLTEQQARRVARHRGDTR